MAMNAPERKAIAPGIHRISMDAYLADPCPVPSLSASIAHRLNSHSPKHAWWSHPRLNPNFAPDERGDFDLGTCVHAVLLERSEASIAVIDPQDHTGARGGVPKGWTNDSIRGARDEARAAGKTPVLTKDMDAVREMAAAARDYVARSEIAGIFDAGAAEQTLIWTEGADWFRARPDWLTDDRSIMLHFKTTGAKAEPESFGRSMLVQMGYDLTAMFYERGLYGIPADDGRRNALNSVFLVQETEPPYACSLIGLDPEMQDFASRKVERAVRLWSRCMKSGEWPSYPSRICYVAPKAWQVQEFEERENIDPLQAVHGLQI